MTVGIQSLLIVLNVTVYPNDNLTVDEPIFLKLFISFKSMLYNAVEFFDCMYM